MWPGTQRGVKESMVIWGSPQVLSSGAPSQVLVQVVHYTKGLESSPGLLFQLCPGAGQGYACPEEEAPSSHCTKMQVLPFLPSIPRDSRRVWLCGQRIQSDHGPVDNADEQEDKGDQRVEHSRHHLSHSPAGRQVPSTSTALALPPPHQGLHRPLGWTLSRCFLSKLN